MEVPEGTEARQRGGYLFSAFCAGCHGLDLAGNVILDDPAIGSIAASNLTSGAGGVGQRYDDLDYVRAIRHGLRPDGTPLAIMPSQAYWHLSNDDLGALIAFIKSAPPVDRRVAKAELRPLGRILVGLGLFEFAANRIVHDAKRPAAPAPGVTPAYGAYLVNVGDCRLCHGAALTGGRPPEPGAPFAPGLTGKHLAEWGEAGFIATMRTGVNPEGHALDPRYMPWRDYARLSNDDLAAIYAYLQSAMNGTSAQ
ncbi:c-type cytochrome [Oceanithermus desulfurans]|uniref:c-type cytochrome n=1 Tax=Oceanithermus desulfurans TaxID=227924 RepID=UPI0016161D3C|nr:c-type cytochrome [Oceanithermus desulfurans]